MELEKLGWNGFFAGQLAKGAGEGAPARVASAGRERFVVWTEFGEAEAGVSGNLRKAGETWPAVGDWVVVRPDAPLIEHVLERRTVLSRKQPGRPIAEQVMAANIDVLLIVTGLDGDYNERRIERYLVVARQSGARPVIVLNKADLHPMEERQPVGTPDFAADQGIDLAATVERLRAWSGVSVLSVSALTGEGMDGLGGLLRPGETAALIGSSGAGKSTIVNRLLGERRQATREVRSDDDRGRHTTTTRSMFLMPGGWLLIDMPGLREVQLWASGEDLDAGFEDVRELATGCRFRDCTHTAEPGCAVRDSGIDEGRLGNYRKMQREVDYLERKTDKRLMSETRARWKAIHKAMRKRFKSGCEM